MKFTEWKNYVLEKRHIDAPADKDYQCVDLYNHYCQNVLEIPHSGAWGAKALPGNYEKNEFEIIYNYPEFVPKKGDVVIFNNGDYGHVAICTGIGDTNTYETIDQNWKPQEVSIERHNYKNLKYFLRPKNQKNIIEEIPKINDKGYIEYTVKAGDNLNYIASKYNTTWQKIAEDNSVATPNLIYPGQVFKIYPNTVDIEKLAKEVIQGKHGNGKERKEKLGYLYEKVQKRVNEILG